METDTHMSGIDDSQLENTTAGLAPAKSDLSNLRRDHDLRFLSPPIKKEVAPHEHMALNHKPAMVTRHPEVPPKIKQERDLESYSSTTTLPASASKLPMTIVIENPRGSLQQAPFLEIKKSQAPNHQDEDFAAQNTNGASRLGKLRKRNRRVYADWWVTKDYQACIEKMEMEHGAELKKLKTNFSNERIYFQYHENESRRLEQENDSLRAKLEESKRDVYVLRKQMERAEKLSKEFGVVLKEYHRLTSLTNMQSEKLQHQKMVMQDQEQNIRQLQETVLQLRNQDTWMPEQDSDTSRKINALERLVGAWVDKNAIQSWAAVGLKAIGTDEAAALKDMLSSCVDLSFGLAEGLDHPRMDKTAPQILLSAWLLSVLYTSVVAEPYFFVKDLLEVETGTKLPDLQLGLSKLFQVLKKSHGQDSSEVHTWRAQLFRLLEPHSEIHEDDAKSDTRLKVEEARAVYSSQAAEKFLCCARRFLRPDLPGNCREKLFNIFQAAGLLSFNLATQKGNVRQMTLANVRHAKFDAAKDVWTPHQLHYGDMHGNGKLLDGRPIILVAHPGLMVRGDSGGTDYSVRRWLKKATVWMGNIDQNDEGAQHSPIEI
ncbi:hypothetical protein EJ08DRAFT_680145 [Tothia fuscella]|uniref:Uncharacterized protein n=1 Tax=Tothia fuscella TaxID=1048955 RepID=A0A9P4TWE9_9PEZI|nr:hypothetical protein EJ08DRAFT_680145 [Tothia fuscella]